MTIMSLLDTPFGMPFRSHMPSYPAPAKPTLVRSDHPFDTGILTVRYGDVSRLIQVPYSSVAGQDPLQTGHSSGGTGDAPATDNSWTYR